MRIYVGNLNYSTTQEMLEGLFAQHGEVEEVHVPLDRASGRPRGFAFVTMPNDEQGRAAIAALNGADLDGRPLTVNEARPRGEGPRGGGFRRGR
jgi:RNA recognition motif-containing protein